MQSSGVVDRGRQRRFGLVATSKRGVPGQSASVCFVTCECVVFVLVVFALFGYPFIHREFSYIT